MENLNLIFLAIITTIVAINFILTLAPFLKKCTCKCECKTTNQDDQVKVHVKSSGPIGGGNTIMPPPPVETEEPTDFER